MDTQLFNDPRLYENRELSWLAFNERVLEEGEDKENPLLERCRFAGIFGSNLDEFFMVRVAGLKDQVKANFNKRDSKAGLTPKEQLKKISERTHRLVQRQYKLFRDELVPQLNESGIHFLRMKDLTVEQYDEIERYFDEQIFPVLTPLTIDAYRPFPMLQNKTLNLAVLLEDEEEVQEFQTKLGIVQVPAILHRCIEVTSLKRDEQSFVFVEHIITHFLHKLFKGYKLRSVTQIRITRNADLTIHEEGARDLLLEIEKELKKRKWGAAVRLEVAVDGLDHWVVAQLKKVLEIHDKDVYVLDGPLDQTFFFPFYKRISDVRDGLVYEALIPQSAADLGSQEDIFQKALEQDIFLHHPYESFEPIIDFIADASVDPDVLAIKQTLYRVSGDSPIIHALKVAAENGKQVTVLVELKARFDEENNVHWAKELEKAGCQVIYGMNLLKTHSKITLIVRRKRGEIQRFVHLGTGNYNDATAKFYTDMGVITSNKEIGEDATNFFNYLTGYTDKPEMHHLELSPLDIREMFIREIDEEIKSHKRNGNGLIIAKMNSLTDKPLIQKLFEASMEGVKIELIIRGTCCLKPGIPGVSDNITVRSIVGRYLEHSRIFYFYRNGEEKVYLSSADWMTRNMEKRVEITFPLLQHHVKQRVIEVLRLSLADNVKARLLQSDGTYVKRENGAEERCNSQLRLFEKAYRLGEDEE